MNMQAQWRRSCLQGTPFSANRFAIFYQGSCVADYVHLPPGKMEHVLHAEDPQNGLVQLLQLLPQAEQTQAGPALRMKIMVQQIEAPQPRLVLRMMTLFQHADELESELVLKMRTLCWLVPAVAAHKLWEEQLMRRGLG
jgi:hypothetical protein